MKTHTNDFKSQIKEFGREIDSVITYTDNGSTITLGNEDINSITPVYEGNILKSVMKQLDIDSNTDIPLNTVISFNFGVKIRDNEVLDYRDNYDYINFGNYIVYKSEKQEDTESYKITCYDKMLYSMVDYVDLGITYPITIRNYINTICTHLGLTFKNASSTFANYNREIAEELYLDEDGESMGYTFRDVLDELAQATASTICINEVDDELEVRYLNTTNDTIDEEYLKSVNVSFGESYGPVNTIVLSRSSGTDKIALSNPQNLPDDDKIAIEIADNQIMNGNDRGDYLSDILTQLYGLQYYINDFASTGICYYNLCDKYNVSIGGNTYNCVMLNDEINITQGLEENIHTDKLEESVNDYKYVTETDKTVREASIIINKKIGEVDIRGKTINLDADNISITSPNFSVTTDGEIISKSGTIGGYNITDNGLYSIQYTKYDYTQQDVTDLADLIINQDPPWTEQQLDYYDLDGDGDLTIVDVTMMNDLIQLGVDTTHGYTVEMRNSIKYFENAFSIIGPSDDKIVNINPRDGFVYNGMIFAKQKELWSGAYYMNASQSIDLTDTPISSQPHGIVLIWSAYSNGQEQNWDWVCTFIPKFFAQNQSGNGILINMNTLDYGSVGSKYVYVSDTQITGHANNTATGTGSGISYKNNHWVLRYVIGI